MVIAGQQGRSFERQDAYLLELLSAQAAVAIAHSRLFAEQQALTVEVEAAHSQLETVLEGTESPVLAVDRRLRLIFANSAAYQAFESLEKGLRITDVLPGNVFPESYKSVLRDIQKSNGVVYEIAYQDKIYLCHLAPLGESRISGWVAVLNEITQLKELDRLKSEMVRMASHDLKNPLMGAMAYLDLLNDDLKSRGMTDLQPSVEMITWQLERMNRIIRGILDLERLKFSTSSMQVCDPAVIVKNSMAELEDFIAQKGLKVNVAIEDEIPGFLGDGEQFERVIVNLLENAVKFTLIEGGQINLNVCKAGDDILFQIEDNGIGIPQAIQTHVFERFFRGQQRGIEHVTGSGLGLSLVKTIVENHGGKIWLESAENEGATFFVSVPCVPMETDR